MESDFRIQFLAEVVRMFPTVIEVKADPSFIRGIPDRFLFYKDRWIALEFKRSSSAAKRPNQQHYIDLFRKMSYASFVYPENSFEVLDAIQRTFRP